MSSLSAPSPLLRLRRRPPSASFTLLNSPNGGFKGIVFKGGGVKGMAYVGALQALEDKGISTSSMEYFAGSSAGSIVAAAVAAGMTPKQLEKTLYAIDWSKVMDGSSLLALKLLSLVRFYGLYNGRYLEEEVVERLLEEQTQTKRITFKQLYEKTGKYLRVTGTDLSNEELDIFDPDSAPDMVVSKAVHISSCVPLFFRAVDYKETFYVDGGTLRNLDLTAFEGLIEAPERALAMDLVDKGGAEEEKIGSLVDFLLALVGTLVKYANRFDNRKPDNVEVVPIDTTGVKALNFDITREEQELLYSRGYDAVAALPKEE